jgi:hypothetical protein
MKSLSSRAQTWNRYAYVRNSPLDSTDPSGLDNDPTECLFDPFCWLNGWGFPAPPSSNSFLPDTNPPVDWHAIIFGPLDPSLVVFNLIGCLNAQNHPVFCTDPAATIDCDDGATPGELGSATVKVPDACYLAYQTLEQRERLGRPEGKPSCLAVAFDGAVTALDPLNLPSFPAGSDFSDAAKTAGKAAAVAHIVRNGLGPTLRSSTVRNMIFAGEVSADFLTYAPLVYSAGTGYIAQVKATLAGTCHNAW